MRPMKSMNVLLDVETGDAVEKAAREKGIPVARYIRQVLQDNVKQSSGPTANTKSTGPSEKQ